jgi:hypothetical protein
MLLILKVEAIDACSKQEAIPPWYSCLNTDKADPILVNALKDIDEPNCTPANTLHELAVRIHPNIDNEEPAIAMHRIDAELPMLEQSTNDILDLQ